MRIFYFSRGQEPMSLRLSSTDKVGKSGRIERHTNTLMVLVVSCDLFTKIKYHQLYLLTVQPTVFYPLPCVKMASMQCWNSMLDYEEESLKEICILKSFV